MKHLTIVKQKKIKSMSLYSDTAEYYKNSTGYEILLTLNEGPLNFPALETGCCHC